MKLTARRGSQEGEKAPESPALMAHAGLTSPAGAVLIGWLNALGKGLELLASTEKKAWLHWQGVGRGRVGRKKKGKKFLARSLSPDRKSQGGSFPFLYFCF